MPDKPLASDDEPTTSLPVNPPPTQPSRSSSAVSRVARNISFLFAYQVASRALGLVLNLVLARRLEDTGYGRYSLILVIIMLVGMAADFGTANILIRDISRQRDRANSFLVAALLLKLITTLMVAGSVAVIILTAAFSRDFAVPLMIATLSIIPTSMSTAIESTFQAFERMDLSALADVVFSLALTAAGVAVVYRGGGVTQMAGVYLAASFVRLGYSGLVYRHLPRVPSPWKLDGVIFRHLVKESFPVLYWQLISLAYYKVDVVLLGAMRPEAEVGWYAAAYKLFEVITMFGWLAVQALLPLMSTIYQKSKDNLYVLFEKTMKYVWIAGLGVAILLMALSGPAVSLMLTPDYLPAVNMLRVLGFAVPLMVGCTLFGNLFVAMNLQGRIAKWSLLSLAVNVGLNLVLIPRFGAMGAAVTTLLSEVFSFVFFYSFTAYYLRHVRLLEVFVFPALVAGGLLAVLLLMRNMPVYVVGAVGIVGYPALLLFFHVVSHDDMRYFRRMKAG